MNDRFIKLYMAVMAIFGAIAALMTLPNVATVVMFVTMGLAGPLALSATLVPYLALFLPAVLSPRRFLPFVLPGSIVLATIWYIGPHWQSMQEAEAVANRLKHNDFTTSEPVGARTFELRRANDSPYGLGGHVMSRELCPEFCRNLLLGDEVDWVRVITTNAGEQGNPAPSDTSVLFVAATGTKCGAPGELPIESTRCVIFAEDDLKPAEIVAELTESKKIENLRLRHGALIQPRGKRVMTISRRDKNGLHKIVQQTELVFSVIRRGSILGPEFNEMHSGGLRFARSSANFNAIDPLMLFRSVGYKVADFPAARPLSESKKSWRDPPTADQTRAVLSLLEMPVDRPFNSQQSEVIRDWIRRARAYEDWPNGRVEFLRRIVRDTRVTSAAGLGQILSRNPTLAAALMPDILDRIAMNGEGSLGPGYEGASAMRKIDPAILAPYAPRILSLVARGDRAAGMMFYAVGRVGVDPAPYFRPIRSQKDGQIDNRKVKAACYAEFRWKSSLTPLLRDLVTEVELARPKAEIEDVLAALMRFGDRDFVEQAIARSNWSDADRVRRQLTSKWKKFGGASEHFC